MPTNPPHSQRTPAEWTGASVLMQKWLSRRSGAESLLNLAGGVFFLVFGLLALIVTAGVGAGLSLFILIEASVVFSIFGFNISTIRPVLFACLFLLFLALTIRHAYRTRKGTDGPAVIDLDLSLGMGLFWEFVSAGPIMLLLAGQEFHRYYRLSRLDIPHVSSLLLWVYDKGGRASFAEICMAFPDLNAVRVLPQLRDLPGIHWWPEDAEVSVSEDLLKSLAEILHREPKSAPAGHSQSRERPRYGKPVAGVAPEIVSWYDTLNLPLFAPLQDVKKRYRKLAKIHHPDVQSANKPANDDQMKRINEAYHNILRHSQGNAGPAQ